jgi:hypothetical protein
VIFHLNGYLFKHLPKQSINHIRQATIPIFGLISPDFRHKYPEQCRNIIAGPVKPILNSRVLCSFAKLENLKKQTL